MNKENVLNNHNSTFPFYLRRSFYIHCLLLALTLITGKIIIQQKILNQQKNLQVIQASVRVDVVEMPKFTLSELKNVSSGEPEVQQPAAKVEVKEDTKEEKIEDKSKVFEEESKKKHQDFLGKLKEISNKKIKDEKVVKAEKGLNGESSSQLKDLVVAGNKLNSGVALTGSLKNSEMTSFQIYLSKLPDRIRPFWKLPTFLLNKKNLKCRIQIWLNMNGAVTRAEVYQSSGDSEYDSRALSAVQSASPFPRLKEEYGRRAINGDIVLGFPL